MLGLVGVGTGSTVAAIRWPYNPTGENREALLVLAVRQDSSTEAGVVMSTRYVVRPRKDFVRWLSPWRLLNDPGWTPLWERNYLATDGRLQVAMVWEETA